MNPYRPHECVRRVSYPRIPEHPRWFALLWLALWGPSYPRESANLPAGWRRFRIRTAEALWDLAVASMISFLLVLAGCGVAEVVSW